MAELAAVDSAVLDFVGRRSVPDISVSVLLNGRTYFDREYSASQNRASAQTDPIDYGLGSIKKTGTAAAIFYLASEGVIDLDDPVSAHAVSVSVPGREPTVRQLLHHTSGFPQSSDDEPISTLDFEPGSEWEYNNANFDKLDEVIATATGRSFDQLLRADLGGSGMGMCEGDRPSPRLARGHTMDGGVLNTVDDPCWFYGSTQALASWVDRLFAGDVIPPELVAQMVEPTGIVDGTVIPFGAGISLRPLRSVRRWSHSGHDTGSTAAFGHYPDHGLTIAVAGNSDSLWDPDALEMAVALSLLGLPELSEPSSTNESLPRASVFSAGPVAFEVAPSDSTLVDLAMVDGSDRTHVFVRTLLQPIGGGRYIGIDSPEALTARVIPTASGSSLAIHIVGIPWRAVQR